MVQYMFFLNKKNTHESQGKGRLVPTHGADVASIVCVMTIIEKLLVEQRSIGTDSADVAKVQYNLRYA
jgi:hypothetical protein